MIEIETCRLTADGITTSVLVGGAGRPDEAVVFVHGNPGAGSDWMPLMTRVAEFATVVAPDLPGFGAAGPRTDGNYTVAGYARFLDDVIGQLGIERVHVVAHDFGGPFAATWAADHPERVASVTMVNTGVLIDYRWHRLARVWRTPVVGEMMMRLTNLGVARFVVGHDNPGLPEPWVDVVARHLVPAETKRAVLKLYRSTRTADIEALAPRLHRHDIDALVVFGDADVYIPAEQAHRQVRAFPRAEVHVLPGVGHWSWLEQTDQVAAHIVPFLRQRVGGAQWHRKFNQHKEIHMSTAIDNRPVNLEAFAKLPPDAPVFMINLLKFNDGGGRDRYLQYGLEVQPHLERVGAAIRYAGTGPLNVIGDGEQPWWDAILVVEYPSPQAFVDMVLDEGYQKVHEHRAAALEQGDLVATSQWVLG